MLKYTIVFIFFFNIVLSQAHGKDLDHEKFEILIKKIRYLNTAERIITIKSLEKLKEEDQKKFYDELANISLNDSDSLVRESALRFLAEKKTNCPLCIEAYKKNILDEEEKIQIQALRGIENLEIKDWEKEFLEIINKTDFSQNGIFVNALLRVLGKLKYNSLDISNAIKVKLNDQTTNSDVKKSIILYIGTSENQYLKDILFNYIDSENDDVYLRAYAINSIGKLSKHLENKSEIITKLKAEFDKINKIINPQERIKFNPVKQQIIITLIRLGDDTVKDEFKKSALDDDANMRKKAIQYIGDLDLKEFIELVETKAKYDPSKSVREEAKKVLEKWGKSQENSK